MDELIFGMLWVGIGFVMTLFGVFALKTPDWRLEIYKKYGAAKETHRPLDL